MLPGSFDTQETLVEDRLMFRVTMKDNNHTSEIRMPRVEAVGLIEKWLNSGKFDPGESCFRGFDLIEKIEVVCPEEFDRIKGKLGLDKENG
jgi:hypothetical protein